VKYTSCKPRCSVRALQLPALMTQFIRLPVLHKYLRAVSARGAEQLAANSSERGHTCSVHRQQLELP
jgi:hypothetical protein